MFKKVTFYFILILLNLSYGCMIAQNSSAKIKSADKGVSIKHIASEKKVEVMIDGKLFTAYIYPSTIKKPVLYPIITPNGTKITRKYPLEASVGERVDHPHHVGMWFNYGDVNGYDFWNNSDAIPEDKRDGYGTIVHQSIDEIVEGKDSGKLSVTMHWISPKGTILIVEKTTFIFSKRGSNYGIDRITNLTAASEDVSFKDNKEGVLGIRVIRALEQPADKPEIFTDANGLATSVAKLDNTGVNGLYTNADGTVGDDCWGKRSSWVKLGSSVGKENITVAILDHMDNVGYPTYWHTRGYGLFAANPLGQEVFSNGKEKLDFSLKKGESTTFKHRVIVASEVLEKPQLDRAFMEFSKM